MIHVFHGAYLDTKMYQVSSIVIHLLSSFTINIIDTFEVYRDYKSLIGLHVYQYWYIYCQKSRKTLFFQLRIFQFRTATPSAVYVLDFKNLRIL